MDNIDNTLDAVALEIKRLAELAQNELETMLAVNGSVTAAQVRSIQERFNAEYVKVLAPAMGKADGNPWDVRMVEDMRVSGLKLSDKLYLKANQTAREVTALIAEHAKGQMQARELAMRLYDGYNPKDGIKRPLEGVARSKLPAALRKLTADPADRAALQQVYEQGQRYAATLKTEPLKAAYMQALETWKKGKSQEALKRSLDMAHREKTRQHANRIAQTEVARAHQDAVAREFMADDTIEVVQVVLSAAHPRVDICDLHGRADLFGLGRGCYPKAKAPKPIYHPFCRCKLRSRPDLFASAAVESKNAEAAYLRSLPLADAARVMGSRDRLQKMLNGAKLDDVVNATQDPYYKMQRLGNMTDPELPVDKPKPKPVVPPVASASPLHPWSKQTPTAETDWHDAAFAESPDWIKVAVAKRGTLARGVTNTGKPGEAWFMRGQDFIDMDSHPKDKLFAQNVWRHEYGHALDNKLSKAAYGYRSSHEDFTKAMKADALSLKKGDARAMNGTGGVARLDASTKHLEKSMKEFFDADDKVAFLTPKYKALGIDFDEFQSVMKKHTDFANTLQGVGLYARYRQILNALELKDGQRFLEYVIGMDYPAEKKATLEMGAFANLSDLFGSATKNKVGGFRTGFGHSDSYYGASTTGRQQTESFANLFALYGDQSPIFGLIVERFTPNMARVFKKIVQDAP